MAIDLRSDTVTRPTTAMKQAMCNAEVGDDIWGDDPTVIAFQEEVAARFGKEAALFTTSCTQANLIAILCHCQRGDEYIVADEAHCYRWEGGGAAVLGSVQPQPISIEADGTLDLGKVENKIKPDDPHHAISKLLCLENTHYGKIHPLHYLPQAKALCDKHQLKLHIDGARIFNAAAGLGIDVKEIVKEADSISLCLSKGLGCPMGALFIGSKKDVARGLRWRKMLGGAMRQSGMLAAAGQYALKHHVERLADDHRHAERLADGIRAINDPRLQLDYQATNMVFANLAPELEGGFQKFAAGQGLILAPGTKQRWVTHLDVSDEDVDTALAIIKAALEADIQASSEAASSRY